jgi:hypothetical protein
VEVERDRETFLRDQMTLFLKLLMEVFSFNREIVGREKTKVLSLERRRL